MAEWVGVDRANSVSLDRDCRARATGPGTEGFELFDVIVFPPLLSSFKLKIFLIVFLKLTILFLEVSDLF